jgi:hypothetical protein
MDQQKRSKKNTVKYPRQGSQVATNHMAEPMPYSAFTARAAAYLPSLFRFGVRKTTV